ncbi:MAG: sigma-B regulation protein RsbU (phosphoserine phosphatase) [Pseudohongiellaceae bacterium]|jgi:sigma-B regulation protein RsbU (phosphoserine phosphatase)
MNPITAKLPSHGPKLLLIDDDAAVRRSFSVYLEDSGYSIIEAPNGVEGVALFESEHPDLVLCDLRMPDVDGLDVIRQVAAKDGKTPIIVISGYGEVEDAVQALRLGAADYLMKPIKNLEVLEHSVRRTLQQANLLAQNEKYSEDLERSNSHLQHSLDLLRMDQQAGRLVQTRLLPDTPLLLDGVSFQHKIVPSLYLSGDFVDYWKTDDGKLVFYIADVSGHGASSAFVTVLLKYMARDVTNRLFQKAGLVSMAGVLVGLNKELSLANLQKHVTAFFGMIDPLENTLSYASAGHYPMPIIGANNSYTMLEARSYPIGIQAGATYEEKVISLGEQFTINLFSDGVLELLKSKGLDEKESQLIELVKAGQGKFHAVYEGLGLDSVSDAPDDVALLTVEKV